MKWSEKLVSWAPSHFKTPFYTPYFDMAGALLEAAQKDFEDMVKETYIQLANTDDQGHYPVRKSLPIDSYLDEHAKERFFKRVVYEGAPELDDVYQNRVRRIKYTRTKQNVIRNIASVTGILDARIVDDYEIDVLSSGDSDKTSDVVGTASGTKVILSDGLEYGNYGPLDLKKRQNCFSILIERPIRAPHAFFDSDAFFNSLDFMDTKRRLLDEGLVKVLQTLIQQKIPAGAGYRLLIKDFDGVTGLTTEEQEAYLNQQFNR